MRHRHRPGCGCPKCIVYPTKHNVVHHCTEETVQHVHPSHTTIMNHHLIQNQHVFPHSTSVQNTVNSVDVYGGSFNVPGPGFGPGPGPGMVAGAMAPGMGPGMNPGQVAGAMSPGMGPGMNPGQVAGAMSPGMGPGMNPGQVAGAMSPGMNPGMGPGCGKPYPGLGNR
ncbi:spore coat protein [Ornithinibacillus scapharcae]|uniref:spore coat protein n=1 Tax=Ornithinibacillus scapharcae TaxID=1147159 RepID=UPI000225ADD3|nr:spore coat protein [Ornithinibacillus scapharcae]